MRREQKRLGPRWGLGPGRVDPEWARFASPADVLRYLCDFHCWSHAQLAERCGVRREQVTRWLNRRNELTLHRLAELLEPLGWEPRLGIVRTEDALAALHTDPPHTLLEYSVHSLVRVAADAAGEGLDVIVGGEVAAVLQGVSVPTRMITLFVRPQHDQAFVDLARKRWMDVEQVGGKRHVRAGHVLADLRLAPVLPPSRLVEFEGRDVPVVDLRELVRDAAAIEESVRAAAGRLLDRAG